MKKYILATILLAIVIGATLYLYPYIKPSVWYEDRDGLRIGVEFNTHATPIWLALHEKLFEKHGLKIERVFKFRTGADLAAAFTRGEIDIGFACLGPILKIIDRGVDVVIVGMIHRYGYSLIVDPTVVKNLSELEKVTVYTTGLANPANLLLLKIKRVYNVNFNVRVIGDPRSILVMLLNHEVHAVSLPEHYASIAVVHGFKVLIDSRDVWNNMPGSFIVVRKSIVEEKPWIVEKLICVVHEAIDMVCRDSELAIRVDEEYLGIDGDIAETSISKLIWSLELNISEIQDYIDFMYENDLLNHRLDAREIVIQLNQGSVCGRP